MKALVLGAAQMKGVSKRTGSPYDMSMVFIGKQVEAVANESMTRRGEGYQPVEIRATPELVDALAGQKLPAVLELVTDSRVQGRGLETIVTGVAPAS